VRQEERRNNAIFTVHMVCGECGRHGALALTLTCRKEECIEPFHYLIFEVGYEGISLFLSFFLSHS